MLDNFLKYMADNEIEQMTEIKLPPDEQKKQLLTEALKIDSAIFLKGEFVKQIGDSYRFPQGDDLAIVLRETIIGFFNSESDSAASMKINPMIIGIVKEDHIRAYTVSSHHFERVG